MKFARTSIVVIAVMAALTVVGRADDKDKDKNKAATDAFVQFGELVTPAPAAGSLAGTLTHFLLPDDVTIRQGGTVTFVINGGGHGVRSGGKDSKKDMAKIASPGSNNAAAAAPAPAD